MCEIIAKEICNRCGKGIFAQVIRIIDEGKIPIWNDTTKRWENEKYYHPECAPTIIDTMKEAT